MSYKNKVKKILINNIAFENLKKYVALIEKQNKFMNLTGFSGDILWKEAIYESIICLKQFNMKGKLLDIGAGAGFPSIPYLIVYPHINLTIIEPNSKRINFLNKIKEELNLNFKIINKRAEETKQEYQYDFITARAVAPLYKLIEISFHLGKIDSKFLFIKGPKVIEEINEAKKILNSLKLKINIQKINEIDYKNINIAMFLKNKKHPLWMPKKWNQIKK